MLHLCYGLFIVCEGLQRAGAVQLRANAGAMESYRPSLVIMHRCRMLVFSRQGQREGIADPPMVGLAL